MEGRHPRFAPIQQFEIHNTPAPGVRIRKCRRGGEPVSRKQTLWRVGLYIRLSKDDGHKESLSVQNQRKILLDFLEHEFQGAWVLVG